MGMEYDVAMRWPMGKLSDLMAIQQIKEEGAKWIDIRIYDPETMNSYDAIPNLR